MIEGYRELQRAVHCAIHLRTVFYCPPLFLGTQESSLLDACRRAGATLQETAEAPFRKMAYRDRPDGLLGIGQLPSCPLEQLTPPKDHAGLYLVADHIEKPGNLGTMLRSADATGCDAVLVSDGVTDFANPNVVRASVGTLFTRPVVAGKGAEIRGWLAAHGIQGIAATPHATSLYTEFDYTGPTAIVVGAEQFGLSEDWFSGEILPVRIPMHGEVDSLNVSAAATVLLYEVVRQRA